MSTNQICKINANRKTGKQVCKTLSSPTFYQPDRFGLSSNLTGKGVSVCVIDTGEPDHKDIKNIGESVELSDSSGSVRDTHGHSTMISGLIGGSNKKGVYGLAPESELLFAKVSGRDNKCAFSCVVAGVLWGVVKEVDIILISLSSESNFSLLHDAIKKAYQNNICVIASAGQDPDSPQYPACYPEVLSVTKRKSTRRAKKFISVGGNLEMVLPSDDIYTTHLNNKYTKASGTSLSAATAAGLAALIIERESGSESKSNPRRVYSELSSLRYSA